MDNLALMFGAIVSGGVLIHYGVGGLRQAFAGTAASAAVPGSSGPLPTPDGRGYVPPLPTGTRPGRTDQGVDFGGIPAGTPVRSIGRARVVGILPNWYSGQPFVWTQLLDGPEAGQFVYYAEQLVPTVHPGQVLQAGEPVGHVAATGTGLELGYATASGETLARATSGYVEGQATAAGQRFAQLMGSLGL